MKTLTEQQLQVRIPVVAWLLIVFNGILLLFALALFVLFRVILGLPDVARDPDAQIILPIVGTIIPLVLGVLTLPDFIAAIGILAHKGWGRSLGIVVGMLNLPFFPSGTLVGGYTLYVLLQENAKGYFEQPRSGGLASMDMRQKPSGA